jgi:hypothetical protein
MKVELIDYTQNGLANVILAGRNCYQSKSKNFAEDITLAKALVKLEPLAVVKG